MKSQRQAKIVEIIANRDVQTQEQLLEELRDAGFRTTQATISRDIKELRIVKEMAENGGYRYAQNIIVVRTMPGLASAAASAIDALNWSSVVGTLAGDDTLFIVMRENNAAAALCGEIKNLLV